MTLTIADLLERSEAFGDLSTEERDALESAMTVRVYPDKHLFTEEGKRGKDIYFILSGRVLVQKRKASGRGHEIVKTVSPGSIIGIIALVDPGPRTATCQAIGPVTAASLPESVYLTVKTFSSPLGHGLQLALARQLAMDLSKLTKYTVEGLKSSDPNFTKKRLKAYLSSA